VDNKPVLYGLAGVGIIALLYMAQKADGGKLDGVPQFQTEAQFTGLNTDLGMRVNAGTPLDLSAETHFFVSGYCCPGQSITTTRHRYPVVSGGNVTAVINRGHEAMIKGSPDNAWRVTPPSEANL
jgi:hypothetical protein